MTERGRRRSARLIALEEQKNKKEACAPMDLVQATGDGQERKRKRGRKLKTDKIYEVAQHPQQLGPNRYGEVSHKARPNASDATTYQQAGELQSEVQLGHEYLKNNQTSYEKLSTWSQTFFNTTEEVRKDGNVRTLSNAAQPHGPQGSSHPRIHSDINQSGMEINVASNGRILSLNQNLALMRTPQTRAMSRPHYREDERRQTYNLGNDSSEPIVSLVYKQPVQLVYNDNGPSYKESLTNYVEDASHQAGQAAKHNFQEYAQQEKAQSMQFDKTPYTPGCTSSFSSQFGSCSSNPSNCRDAAPGIAARDMHFSPTTDTVSSITGGNLFPSAGINDKLGFDLNEEPSSELETDEPLRTFSQVGMPKFLVGNKNTLTSSASQSVEPNQSFNPFLNGERDYGMVAALPTYTVASPMTQLGQYVRSEPAKRMSIYDIPCFQAPPDDSEKLEQKGSASSKPKIRFAPMGSSSGNRGFRPYVGASGTSEPKTLDLFK